MIKKIKWNNHKVLGDLELDFSKQDGSVYNTIILAGENGAGKTTILDTLAEFLNLGSFENFKYINYIAANIPYLITPSETNALFGFHKRRNELDGTIKNVNSNRNNNFNHITIDTADIRHYGFSYSKARSGFNTQKVRSSTIQQLDNEKYESDTKEDFNSIKQLLIDIDLQDSSELKNIVKKGLFTDYESFHQNTKLFRFENAFNSFFDTIKFKGINSNNPDEIQILFEKHGRDISVDNLSTGEKQVVFRGAHLLKNLNSMEEGIVLIDEPELSMHPKWQQKILQYYRNLFTKGKNQTVQMFFATHSEYVLKSALEDRENVLIIVLYDDNGTIKSKNITAPTILPSITSAETNYIAFGILSSDYHIELYAYLQNKTKKYTVKSCDNYIAAQSSLYNPVLHEKLDSFINQSRNKIAYKTLPTYIRNAIDHPDSSRTYTEDELRISTELLIELCR